MKWTIIMMISLLVIYFLMRLPQITIRIAKITINISLTLYFPPCIFRGVGSFPIFLHIGKDCQHCKRRKESVRFERILWVQSICRMHAVNDRQRTSNSYSRMPALLNCKDVLMVAARADRIPAIHLLSLSNELAHCTNYNALTHFSQVGVLSLEAISYIIILNRKEGDNSECKLNKLLQWEHK